MSHIINQFDISRCPRMTPLQNHRVAGWFVLEKVGSDSSPSGNKAVTKVWSKRCKNIPPSNVGTPEIGTCACFGAGFQVATATQYAQCFEAAHENLTVGFLMVILWPAAGVGMVPTIW